MDREVFPHWMLAFAHDAFPSWCFLATWSDAYCSTGSTRPAQHDTTASVHLTDGLLLTAWMESRASKGCTINPVSCCLYSQMCLHHSVCLEFRVGLQASSLLISCLTLMTVVNLCGVFSPGRTCLFPIAAVDKKISEGSRWTFPKKMMTSPKMDLQLNVKIV